jgi:hypothetical protein
MLSLLPLPLMLPVCGIIGCSIPQPGASADGHALHGVSMGAQKKRQKTRVLTTATSATRTRRGRQEIDGHCLRIRLRARASRKAIKL